MNKLREYLDEAREKYEDGTPIMTDDVYDKYVQVYEDKYGEYATIGTAKKDAVKLPYYLGSLNKIKSPNVSEKLQRWEKKNSGPYLIMDKMDGVSALYENGKLYTRGDGYFGRDISDLIPFLNIPEVKNIAARGEIVMTENVFLDHVEEEKISGSLKKLTDPRSVVAGIINNKDRNCRIAEKLRFITFSVLNKPELTTSEQLILLDDKGFDVIKSRVYDVLTPKILSRILMNRRKKQGGDSYFIDGIVIAQNTPWIYPVGKNPTHMIAYKEDMTMLTKVTHVDWSVEKNGQLFPTVFYEPINLLRATLTRASGKNAAFIINSGIGPGAEILVTRASDVIPDIVKVIKKSEVLDLPNLPEDEYHWDENKVRFILTRPEDNYECQIAKMKHFVKTMGIADLGPGRVTSLFEAGINTQKKLVESSIEDLEKADRIQGKTSKKIHDNIRESLNLASCAELMAASGIFGSGMGIKRAKLLLEHIPDILTTDNLDDKILEIPGIGHIFQNVILANLEKFKDWLSTSSKFSEICQEKDEPSDVDNDYFKDVNILFTGFTDKNRALEKRINKLGGCVKSGFSKNVNLVVAKDTRSNSSKMIKAKKNNISIITLENFEKELEKNEK